MEGWIKLHRQCLDSSIWKDKEPYDKRSAWVYLLLMANHEKKKVMIGQEIIEVDRGQFLTSIQKLSETWMWSRHKTSNFLNLLEKCSMLGQKRDTKKTLITIVNYGLYQDANFETGHQKDIKRTSKGHQKDTNKNVKNDKNEKNIPPKSPKGDRGSSSREDLLKTLTEKSYSVSLQETMERWLIYRQEIGKPFKTLQGFERLLKQLDERIARHGQQTVIDLIDYCMSNQYQGIIWDILDKKTVQKGNVRYEATEKDKRELAELERLMWEKGGAIRRD